MRFGVTPVAEMDSDGNRPVEKIKPQAVSFPLPFFYSTPVCPTALPCGRGSHESFFF